MTISANQKFGLYDAGTYPDFASVKSAFEEVYSCLGITCAQVGGLLVSGATTTDTAACTYAGATYQFEVLVAGDLSDFSTSVLNTMKASVAAQLQVNQNQITISVVTGSVRVTVAIKALSNAQTTSITNAATSYLQSSYGATTLLGGATVVTVTNVVTTGAPIPSGSTNSSTNASANAAATVPTVVYRDRDSDEMPGWGVALVVVVCVLFCAVLILVAVMINKEKSGKPIFTTLVTGSSTK
jgi:hypothetical protein